MPSEILTRGAPLGVVLALAAALGASVAGGARAIAATAVVTAAPAMPELGAGSTPAQDVARGRAIGRALVSFESPNMCAIPLLVARCRSDFDVFVGGDAPAFRTMPGLGPTPVEHMRDYYATGDPASFPSGFGTLRTATAPDALWQKNAPAAFAMDAGIVDETVAASLHGTASIYAAPPASQMFRRSKLAAPADAAMLGTDIATADGHFPAGSLDRLVRAIDARYPAGAEPAIPEATGPRGDVFLGIGYATLYQMCDTPSVLALPESQTFLDAFFAAAGRLSVVPGATRRLEIDREALRFDHTFDAARVTRTTADLVKFQNLSAAAVLRRELVGQFASQVGYNATILRDPGYYELVIRSMTKWNDADDAFPGLVRRRVALGLIDPKDFAAQRRASTDLLAFLLAGTDGR